MRIDKELPQGMGILIKRLYAIRDKLRNICIKESLAFSLDGNLVGDIGEAIAIKHFHLIRMSGRAKGHDLMTPSGKLLVQVKATQSSRTVSLGFKKQDFEHLMVFKINENGTYSVLYDGPGACVTKAIGHKQSASISISKLKELDSKISKAKRISNYI